MHFNGLKLSVALEEFSITSQFSVSKPQKSNFEENKVLSAFFRIEVQVITNPSSRLEKKKRNPDCLLTNDFL